MADLPKYHLRAQQADALLAPVRAIVRDLEERVQHYLDRVTLSDADAAALHDARAALARAAGEIERIWRESRAIPHD